MLDSDKITERVLSGDQKEDSLNIEGIVEDVVKSRVYVDDPSEVPDKYDAQTSDSGAVYYETDSSGGGGMVDEAVDHFEDFVEDIDVTDPQDEFEEEAAQLWSDYTQGMISEDEFDEQVVDFIEEYADETLGDVGKSRVYVDDESEVPDEYDAQVSDSGAVYYETDSSGGGDGDVDMDDERRESVEDTLSDAANILDEYGTEEMQTEMREAVENYFDGDEEAAVEGLQNLEDMVEANPNENELDSAIYDVMGELWPYPPDMPSV